MIRFREKGGKETVLPVNHKLEELLHRYLEISGLKNRSGRRPSKRATPVSERKFDWNEGDWTCFEPL
jgi:hypothetical protein